MACEPLLSAVINYEYNIYMSEPLALQDSAARSVSYCDCMLLKTFTCWYVIAWPDLCTLAESIQIPGGQIGHDADVHRSATFQRERKSLYCNVIFEC